MSQKSLLIILSFVIVSLSAERWTVIEKETEAIGTEGLGQTLGFSSDLFDRDGKKIGFARGVCYVLQVASPEVDDIGQNSTNTQNLNREYCFITLVFYDRGAITFQGESIENLGEISHMAITGGTAEFRKVRGEAIITTLVVGSEWEWRLILE